MYHDLSFLYTHNKRLLRTEKRFTSPLFSSLPLPSTPRPDQAASLRGSARAAAARLAHHQLRVRPVPGLALGHGHPGVWAQPAGRGRLGLLTSKGRDGKRGGGMKKRMEDWWRSDGGVERCRVPGRDSLGVCPLCLSWWPIVNSKDTGVLSSSRGRLHLPSWSCCPSLALIRRYMNCLRKKSHFFFFMHMIAISALRLSLLEKPHTNHIKWGQEGIDDSLHFGHRDVWRVFSYKVKLKSERDPVFDLTIGWWWCYWIFSMLAFWKTGKCQSIYWFSPITALHRQWLNNHLILPAEPEPVDDWMGECQVVLSGLWPKDRKSPSRTWIQSFGVKND